MEDVYRQKFGAEANNSSPSHPGSTMAADASGSYTPETLKQIGEKCRSRLPPASLVQAMFLYEIQRQSEVEHLFHGHLFHLAKSEEAEDNQTKRIDDLETRLTKLEEKTIARDVEERIATSNVRMNAQQEKLNAFSGRLGWAEERLDTVRQQLDGLKKTQEHAATSTASTIASVKEEASKAAAAAAEAAAASAAQTNLPSAEDVTTAKEEINVLFDDRDGILRMVEELKEKMNKVEENVRMLTIQRSTPSVSPASTQRIPIKTANGELVDLSIPKGNPAVSLKENRPMEARSFLTTTPWVPGRQWTG